MYKKQGEFSEVLTSTSKTFFKTDSIKKINNSQSEGSLKCSWNLVDELSQKVSCDKKIVSNVIKLLKKDNTVPFIARYRRDQIGHLEPEKIRSIKENLEDYEVLESTIFKMINKVEKKGQMDDNLKDAFLAANDISIVEELYAPFKSQAKSSKLQCAKLAGLDFVFNMILTGDYKFSNLSNLINPNSKGLKSLDEISEGLKALISDHISKNKDIPEFVHKLSKESFNVSLHSLKVQDKTEKGKTGETSKMDKKSNKFDKNIMNNSNMDDKCKVVNKNKMADKFQDYYNFTCPLNRVKPYQILAIKRGEAQGVLKMKLEIPDYFKSKLIIFCKSNIFKQSLSNSDILLQSFLLDAIEKTANKNLLPRCVTFLKNELKKKSESAAIEVFAKNLKRLLLVPPVTGKVILGIDPGFTNGCKYALISAIGDVLATGIVYLHKKPLSNSNSNEHFTIRDLLLQYGCEVIAIGDGVGSRETEEFFSKHIKIGTFNPLKPVFCTVNEAGASIYSASPEAEKELKDIDLPLRGAVSIARRLQNPLSELVKIDPKNLGVGMYQHDVSEKQLKLSLDGVIEDCVSFVGVDLNLCNHILLQHIAGIGPVMANKILDYRAKNGPFICREQLKSVPGIGSKKFEQCVGFLRIQQPNFNSSKELDCYITHCNSSSSNSNGQSTSDFVPDNSRKRKSVCLLNGKVEDEEQIAGKKKKSKNGKVTKLKSKKEFEYNSIDSTSVHPESYHIAVKIIEKAELEVKDIGKTSFINDFKNFINKFGIDQLALKCSVSEMSLSQIVEGLQQPLDHDIRNNYEKPFFKKGIDCLSSLKIGSKVTGKVMNVTDFGCFVDIGVGTNALLHTSCMRREALQLGDLIESIIGNLDIPRKRISLNLIRLLN